VTDFADGLAMALTEQTSKKVAHARFLRRVSIAGGTKFAEVLP
jgi:hypothetical protein